MSDLIDTTEMYLRTLFELREEGVPPLRARIAERLHQSVPTVSQTVARMERDGLVTVDPERHVIMTPSGERLAVAVMRKHRLAERLLVDVLGLDWAEVHDEACRWEHVMSEHVERRIVALLGEPKISPYGNPIPGLRDLLPDAASSMGDNPVDDITAPAETGLTLSSVVSGLPPGAVRTVRILRIGEHLQTNSDLMRSFGTVGLSPGTVATVSASDDGAGAYLSLPVGRVLMPVESCAQVFVAVS